MKGICKGIKYISKLFVVKERKMEIGCPTDVKHVAHIGWDGPDVNAPSWMSEFKIAADFSVASIGSMGGSRDPTWSSQDLEQLMGRLPSSNMFNSLPPTNVPGIPKKQKRKKKKPSSSPKQPTSSTKSNSSRGLSRTSRDLTVEEREVEKNEGVPM